MSAADTGDQFAAVAHIGLIAEKFLRSHTATPISRQVKAIYRQALDALTIIEAQLAAERDANGQRRAA